MEELNENEMIMDCSILFPISVSEDVELKNSKCSLAWTISCFNSALTPNPATFLKTLLLLCKWNDMERENDPCYINSEG